jgi:hypothetical protein
MKWALRSPETQGRPAGNACLLRLPVLFLILLLAGCAPLMQNLTGGEGAKKNHEAKAAFEQGKYGEARDAYRALAEDQSNPRRAEQAQFNAAYILVYHENPGKDYRRAAREFEEFLGRYPSGVHAGEARSWLDILRSFEQSKTNELLKEVDTLTKKMEDLAKELRKAQAENETGAKERDQFLIEKNNLTKKIDGLLNDKDGLLKEKAALLKERDGLAKDKIDLEKKVDLLTRDKEALTLAKNRLEKSLHDLTMVDIKMEKMEKKRKKVK